MVVNSGALSLTDEQMAVLNPVVRNAIATGLHAEKHYRTGRAARSYLDFHRALVPEYWELPGATRRVHRAVGAFR